MKRSLLLAACTFTLAFASLAAAQVPGAPTGPGRGLPSPVLGAFEKAYPMATITAASTERQEGQLAFRVEALDRGLRRVIVYNVNGSVLESTEQVDEKDLPKAVVDAAHSHPKAVYVKGVKITQRHQRPLRADPARHPEDDDDREARRDGGELQIGPHRPASGLPTPRSCATGRWPGPGSSGPRRAAPGPAATTSPGRRPSGRFPSQSPGSTAAE